MMARSWFFCALGWLLLFSPVVVFFRTKLIMVTESWALFRPIFYAKKGRSVSVKSQGFTGILERVYWKPPEHSDLFLAFSKKFRSVSLVPRFDATIRHLPDNGSIEKIAENYR